MLVLLLLCSLLRVVDVMAAAIVVCLVGIAWMPFLLPRLTFSYMSTCVGRSVLVNMWFVVVVVWLLYVVCRSCGGCCNCCCRLPVVGFVVVAGAVVAPTAVAFALTCMCCCRCWIVAIVAVVFAVAAFAVGVVCNP